jgi:hypothetical protein
VADFARRNKAVRLALLIGSQVQMRPGVEFSASVVELPDSTLGLEARWA